MSVFSLSELENLYTQFLGAFPSSLHPIISLILVILLIYAVFQLVKKDFIYLILLIVLIPASIPILKNLGEGLTRFVKFLLQSS